MIYLGLDPGTSNNMALAALMPETEGILSLHPIRVALIDSGTEDDARSRARWVLTGVRAALERLNLPQGVTPVSLAVEWQQPRALDRRPQNILDLQAFAGLAMASLQSLRHLASILTPLPSEWKGNVKKHIKQNRIVAVAGPSNVQMALTQAMIPVPANLGAFDKEFTGKASDAIDAIGLAFWLRERLKQQEWLRGKMPPSK